LILFSRAILRFGPIFGLSAIDQQRSTGVAPVRNGTINMSTAVAPSMRIGGSGKLLA
jgi:hypothetical protein